MTRTNNGPNITTSINNNNTNNPHRIGINADANDIPEINTNSLHANNVVTVIKSPSSLTSNHEKTFLFYCA